MPEWTAGAADDNVDEEMLVVRDGSEHEFEPSDVLSTAEMADIEEVYRELDSDGNGVLTINEFFANMKADSSYDQAEMIRICAKLDSDQDSRVSLDEFTMARAISKQSVIMESTLNELEKHFKLMDLDGSGAITRAELANVLGGLGYRVDFRELDAIMEQADKDKSGSIGLKEFMMLTKD